MKQYFKDIFESFWTILIGMKVTFSHLFVPAVTIQYPDVRLKLPERARNRLYVNMDDCIGCFQCDIACPVDCIKIETIKSLPTDDLGTTSTGHKKRLWVTRFDIDIAKCCYCGLCVYPCPTKCIVMTDVYEFSEYDRRSLIYNFTTLTSAQIDHVKTKFSEYEKEQAAKKAAATTAQVKGVGASPSTKTQSGTESPTPSTTKVPPDTASVKPSKPQQ